MSNNTLFEPKSVPLRCRLFGHKWFTFDRNWCGRDYQVCQRIGFFPLRTCGSTRGVNTESRHWHGHTINGEIHTS